MNAIPFNACVFKANNKLYPAKAVGCFAGSMFMKTGDDKYIYEVSGESFMLWDYEDQCNYKESKFNVRRPTLEEWNNLFTEEMRQDCIKDFESTLQVA